MKVLFDECIPSALRMSCTGMEVKTAQQLGWGRLKNGDLLARAEGTFDAFVTADKNLRYQQNLRHRTLSILVLPTNHWPTLETHSDWIAKQIANLKPGEYRNLLFPGSP